MTLFTLPFSPTFLLLMVCAFIIGTLFFIIIRTTLKSKQASTCFESLSARVGFNDDVVLHVAASLASPSPNSLAQAIVNEAKKRNIPIKAVSEFKNHPHYGLTGIVDGRIIALGHYTLMQELGIKLPKQAQDNANPHSTLLYISINSYWAGIITIKETQHQSF